MNIELQQTEDLIQKVNWERTQLKEALELKERQLSVLYKYARSIGSKL